MMNPQALSRDLRESQSPFLSRRRGIIGLSLLACAALSVTSLYQIGIIKRLPQPPSTDFNSKKVHGSALAYGMLQVPDSFLGLASYSITACLAAAGTSDRWKTQPLIPIAMAAKLIADAGAAAVLTFDEITKLKALSIWSFLTAGCAAIALPLALPETKAALCRIKSRGV